MENKILAVVNGNEITEKDLQEMALKFPRERQSYLLSEDGRKQFLDQLISYELINLDALERGIDKEQQYIDQLNKVKKDILTQVAITKLLADITVPEEELRKYYEDNKMTFMEEESVSAKHILVETYEAAMEVLKSIEAGMTFEEAASLYSSCPSKAQGGNLGSFTRGRMVPEFEKAAFELEVGVISEPVQTQFGYHVIKVEEKKESSVVPFEEIRSSIENQLFNEKQSEKYFSYTEELKKKFKVEVK